MVFTTAELAALQAGTQRLGAFFRLATSPAVTIWLGVGRIKPGVNTLDTAGIDMYYGFGQLVAVPAFQQLIGGKAQRVEFVMSGVSAKVLALASLDASAIHFKTCSIGFGIMDSNWQLLGPIHWCFNGTADFLRVSVIPASDETSQTTRNITLSVGSQFSGRRRRGMSYWTDQDQQLRSPGDRFCERTVTIAELAIKSWPRF